MSKYYNYHKHDHKGNPVSLDVVVKLEDYCKRAIELGHDTIFTTCHGLQGDLFEATTLAHQYNLKLIVGAELYYVPDRKEKDRSNRHIIIIALNHNGIRELNNIISKSFIDGMYYKPRIDEELLFSLNPENVVVTTACVAGVWNDERLVALMKNYFKEHLFLEVQNHNEKVQKEVNKKVLELSEKYDIKIIHANDSHYINPDDAKYRESFLKAKGITYPEESNFILDYPDYDTIVERYKKQNILNEKQIFEALNNTLIFEGIDCSDYINDDIKLPSISDNPNEDLKKILNESWNQNKDIIPKEKRKDYLDSIRYEMDIIEKTNMANYFLIDYYISKIAKEKYGGVLTKTGRGCFQGDVLVHTLEGIKLLKDVQVGDFVITEDGKFNKVLNTFCYNIEEPMLQIKHLYGTDKYCPTICTLDHKILIYRNNKREWIEAKNINKNDYVCVPKIKFEDKGLKKIDLNDYNDFGYRVDGEYIYEEYNKGNTRYNKKISRYIEVDEVFNQFIGLMYGDGFNNITKKCDIGLAINTENHKNIINKNIFLTVAKRLGLTVKEIRRKEKKISQLYIHSKIFNNFVKIELFQSKRKEEKKFNCKWFFQSKNMVENIILGLLNSDGSVKDFSDYRINFDNTSLSIINAYKLMCLYTEKGVNSLCVRPKWIDKRGYQCRESYKLRINPNAIQRKKIKEDSDYYYLPIKELKMIEKSPTKVYDLEVENNHSYLINNMVVHNSAPSFYITNLLHLTNIDRLASPIKLFPTRFMSIERILGAKSLPDIDLNTADAEPFIKASQDLLGEDNCAWMISWKPLQESSAFRLYCKSLDLDFEKVNEVGKDLDKYRDSEEWKQIIEDSKPFIGVIEGISESPCSICLYDKNIKEEIGMIKTPNGKICCMLDGYNCDKYKYLKNDYLTVTVWAIIRDVCKLANIEIPSINELDGLLDEKTFDIYKNGLTCSINQADSDYATNLVMKYKPQSLAEMSAFVAIIRPGCASLLDDFISRKPYTTGVDALDNILEDSEHRLIYQESIMKYLIWLGISEPQSYDVIKKIAKKKFKEPELKELKARLLEGWHKQVGEEAGFEETWKVVEDAAKYSFNACVSGDTIIQRAGVTKSKKVTIKEMFDVYNNKDYAKKIGKISLYRKYKRMGYGNALSMYDDKRVRKNQIINIYYSGKADIYRVTTENGSYLDCTLNHKFPTDKGKKRLDELKIGDELYVLDKYEKHPDNYRFTNGIYLKNIPKKGQKGFQTIESGNYHKFSKILDYYHKEKLNCSICGTEYRENKRFEIHHKDNDRTNNEKQNLIWCCNSCHKKEHYKKHNRKKAYDKGIPVKKSKIVSIEFLRNDDVYDIEMASPAHNFISDTGLITSNSHSLSYAYDSLYGAYLKSHYPLEYYTVALNYYQNDIDRTMKLTKELSYFGITLNNAKFRYSKDDYFMDKESNKIYKGTSSIKFLNKECSNYLYSLKDNKYNNFIDLLVEITNAKDEDNKSYINSKQMEILIQLQYFEEFGKNKKLLDIYKYFKDIYGRKIIAKDKLEELNLTKEDIDGCYTKETDKQYGGIDCLKILSNVEKRIPDENIPIKEQISFEKDIVGYISATYDVDKKLCLVLKVDKKYSPKVDLYSLKSGKIVKCKINKLLFDDYPLKEGDIIKCISFMEKDTVKKQDGKWVKTGQKEWWLNAYKMEESIE